MIFNTLKVLAIAILINLVSVQVMADRDVSLLQISEGDWIFVPTTFDGSVESFVGLRIDGVTGENITTVWFLRTTEETWDSWAWSEQDQGKAIACIKSILALPDSTDDNWPVAISTEAADPPKVLKKGVLESDPFESTIDGLADPELLVTMLEDTGWAAAWLELWDYDCEDEVVLDTWADVYEYEYSSNEHFKYLANQALMQNDCFTTDIRDDIWCWVDQYWVMFDSGNPNEFNGTGFGIHRDWHPFDEVVQVYESMYPDVPISEAVYGGAWSALSSIEQQHFRDLSLTHEYATFMISGVHPPTDSTPGEAPDYPTVPTDPNCDHLAFYNLILQLMADMVWTDPDVFDCIAEGEGYWDSITNCPAFDCDDFADTIGSCLLSQLGDHGYEVSGRNMKVMMHCSLFDLMGVGHTIFGIYYCGYWYIFDGSSWDRPIGIVPGTPDDPIPLSPGTVDWLRYLNDRKMKCSNGGFHVVPKDEWEPGARPWYEPDPWYKSPSQVAKIVACLRNSGKTDAEIAELFGCFIDADELQQVLQWFDPPNPPINNSPLCGPCLSPPQP